MLTPQLLPEFVSVLDHIGGLSCPRPRRAEIDDRWLCCPMNAFGFQSVPAYVYISIVDVYIYIHICICVRVYAYNLYMCVCMHR